MNRFTAAAVHRRRKKNPPMTDFEKELVRFVREDMSDEALLLAIKDRLDIDPTEPKRPK